jgi:Flp pilus assembly protein TadB
MTGLAAVAAAVCSAVAAGLLTTPRRRTADRLNALRLPQPGPPATETAPAPDVSASRPRPVTRLAVSAVMLMSGPVAVGGLPGIAVGLTLALLVAVVRPSQRGRGADPDDVAVVVDLMAGCLAAGTGLAAALDAAAVAASDQLQRSCQAVAAALRSGVAADDAWQPWLADPWLAPVARTALRTAHTGAAAAADLRRTSARLRARRRSTAQHKVRQASVWLVVPLGLCFLPAFVLVAVVPLVVGLLPTLR